MSDEHATSPEQVSDAELHALVDEIRADIQQQLAELRELALTVITEVEGS